MFVFYKQKTAYAMRISDWSSDVCSSVLVAPLHLLTVLDRDHRADREQIARGFTRFIVEQGQARLKVFLLGAADRAIFDDDALGDAGRFVDLLGQGLGVDQVLILHDTGLFGDQRHGERVPFRDPIPLLHLFAVLLQVLRTYRKSVG